MLRVRLVLVCLLATSSRMMAVADPEQPVTDRGDRAIFSIRVDQKGSSYIIHPDLSRLEAEALLMGARPNATSFFYNVTGLTADAGRAAPYQTTTSGVPASKLLLEALLHNMNNANTERSVEQATARDTEWLVHNGDPISVEDVTHKVFHAATNRLTAQQQQHHHYPLLAPLAHKPAEQLIPSSLVKAPPQMVMLPTSTTHRTTANRPLERITPPPPKMSSSLRTVRPATATSTVTTTKRPTTTTTTKSTTRIAPSSTTTSAPAAPKRPEDPNLRSINSPPEGEQDFYDEEYEDYEEEEETTSTLKTTKATTKPSSQRPVTDRPTPLGVSYIPLNPTNNKNGILTLAKLNATASPARLPEYTVKTGVSSVSFQGSGSSVSSSSLITKTEPMTSSTSTTVTSSSTKAKTTPSPTAATSSSTTTDSFDLTDFLVRVAEDASEVLLEPSSGGSRPSQNAPDRNIPSMIDGSIFGTLFSSDHRKDGAGRPIRPDAPLVGGKLPPPPATPLRGSVHNLNRPGLFSALNQPPVVPPDSSQQPLPARPQPPHSKQQQQHGQQKQQQQQHPAAGGFRPLVNNNNRQQQTQRPDDSHHTTPNTDALIPLFGSPGQPSNTGIVRVTESPGEVDVITAPSQWNLIVSSSLTSSGQKASPSAGGAAARSPRPSSSSMSHRHGYIVDDAEAGVDGPELITAQVGSDGILQHQDSPSRLGFAIDYDEPRNPSGQKNSQHIPAQPGVDQAAGNPSDYMAYEDYEDYAEEPVTNRTTTTTKSTTQSDRRRPTRPIIEGSTPKAPSPPFPYGVNLGDLNDSEDAAANSEEMEGFGAAFPEVISNSVRRAGPPAPAPQQTTTTTKKKNGGSEATQPPRHYLDVEEKRPEVFHTEQAIDAFDKKFRTVEVNADTPVNTTTLPEPGSGASSGELTGAALTYILIGTFGGLSLLFLCAVGITIRCRKRRFLFSTFTTSLMRRSDQRRVRDEESQLGSPNVLTGRRLANEQLAAARAGEKDSGDVATHKLGSWFTGRNSLSSLHGGSQISGTRKMRSEVALPRTTPNTPGRASTRKVIHTRAYFTDGRTGSTRDLITSTTASSESSGSESPGRSPGSPHPPDRNSWLHTSYKDRGNSLSELRDSSFYCITQADAASSDGERPRSTSATVRSPLHHFRSTEELDSIDATPPDLPPKRHHRFSVGDSMSAVDPMGSHVTIQTEASVTTNWGTSVDDRLI